MYPPITSLSFRGYIVPAALPLVDYKVKLGFDAADHSAFR
jgi:hypothetical protein